MSGKIFTSPLGMGRFSAALFLLAILSLPAEATVIYREIFPNISGGNEPLEAEGWSIHSNTGGLAFSQTNSPNFSVPTNLPAIHSFPSVATNSGLSTGYAFTNDANGVDYLFWTNEYSVPTAHYDVTSISWYQGSSNADLTRAAVQIGGQWYASQQSFSNTVGVNNSIQTAVQMTLSMDTATWRTLNFVPDSSLTLGGATTLPSGDITAFGLYTDNKTAQLRFDTFQIDAALPSNVVTLAQYTFPENNSLNPPILTPTTTAANVAVSNLTSGAGVALTTSSGNVPPPSPSGSIILQNLNSTTLGAALTGNDYIRFTVAADPLYMLSIESLSFDFQRDFSTQVTAWALYLEDGSGLQLLHSALLTGSPGVNTNSSNYFSNIALDLWQFPELQDVLGTLAFRLYFYGANSPGANLARLDNLTLLGSATLVPEPSTWLLAACGALGLCWHVRRRRSR